jgi:hypothetical protein
MKGLLNIKKTVMKYYLQNFFFAIAIFSLAAIPFACSKSSDNYQPDNPSSQINSLPAEPLNADELSSLRFLREEEKLAKDVYVFLHNHWGINIFKNISSSEQIHMDAILLLLKKYNLPDPVGNNGPGTFSDTILQNLYSQLTLQGSTSTLASLKVGATIEDLDIYDLKTALSKVDNQDIILVYNNLMKGSRNHLRSFYNNIRNAGGTYVPQFITQAEFDYIINSPMETGGQ